MAANRCTTSEVNLEHVMCRKKDVLTMDDVRNSIPCASLGDKIYKYPTYASAFFKGDGCISGSTNVYRKKTTARLNEVDFTINKSVKWPLRERMLWKTKLSNEIKHDD